MLHSFDLVLGYLKDVMNLCKIKITTKLKIPFLQINSAFY